MTTEVVVMISVAAVKQMVDIPTQIVARTSGTVLMDTGEIINA